MLGPRSGLGVCAFVVCTAVAAFAVPPTPPPGYSPIGWTHEFDFDDGPQGWSIQTVTGATWINPGALPNGPTLADGAPSGTSGLDGDVSCADGCPDSTGGGSLWLTGNDANGDESVASITTQQLLGLPTVANWTMQADIYIPNLLPLTHPNFHGYPGNAITSAGIGAVRVNQGVDDDPAVVEGGRGSGPGVEPELRFRDFGVGCESWGNKWIPRAVCPPGGTNPINPQLSLHHPCGTPLDQWWDRWITLFIDYDFTNSGTVQAWAYVPWGGPSVNCSCTGQRQAGWFLLMNEPIAPECTAAQPRERFILGGAFSWTVAQWDNVKFALPAACSDPFADADEDGDVDQDDFGLLQACITGADPRQGVFDPDNCV